MSRKGNCWDNAPTERFFRSLKSERLSDYRFVTRRSAEIQVLDYISYYNSSRLHSTLGYKTPFAYEKELCRIAGLRSRAQTEVQRGKSNLNWTRIDADEHG